MKGCEGPATVAEVGAISDYAIILMGFALLEWRVNSCVGLVHSSHWSLKQIISAKSYVHTSLQFLDQHLSSATRSALHTLSGCASFINLGAANQITT